MENSNTFVVRKATKTKSKLRIGLSGPSGSGKTYSALLIAKGLVGDWSKIVVIDTENGSADLYDHLGEFGVISLTAPFNPERYIGAIETAEKSGAQAIVIDSASHEWDGKGGCLEINEMMAQTKFKGNTWSAWSATTPRHQAFIEKLVTSPCHIIVTSRSKTETIQAEGKIKKVGMKEIQREGFEYELTLNFAIDRDKHLAIASKDRTEIFIDQDPFLITERTGELLKEWAEAGVPVTKPIAESKMSSYDKAKAEAKGERDVAIAKTEAGHGDMLGTEWATLKEIKTLYAIARAKGVIQDAVVGKESRDFGESIKNKLGIMSVNQLTQAQFLNVKAGLERLPDFEKKAETFDGVDVVIN